ncbi:Cyanovirin-N [Pseudohyphozyma bogoriensis]|nr:Cyanovirin-N [Pseudohyphozyma bogoriensis]
MSDVQRAYIAKTKSLTEGARNFSLNVSDGRIRLSAECLTNKGKWRTSTLDLTPCIYFNYDGGHIYANDHFIKHYYELNNAERVRDVALIQPTIIKACVQGEKTGFFSFLGIGEREWHDRTLDLAPFLRVYKGKLDFMHPKHDDITPKWLQADWIDHVGTALEAVDNAIDFDIDDALDLGKQYDGAVQDMQMAEQEEGQERWERQASLKVDGHFRAYIAQTKSLNDGARNFSLSVSNRKIRLSAECLANDGKWRKSTLDLTHCIYFNYDGGYIYVNDHFINRYFQLNNRERVRDIALIQPTTIKACVQSELKGFFSFVGIGDREWNDRTLDLAPFMRVYNGHLDFMHPKYEEGIPKWLQGDWVEHLGTVLEAVANYRGDFDIEEALDPNNQIIDMVQDIQMAAQEAGQERWEKEASLRVDGYFVRRGN